MASADIQGKDKELSLGLISKLEPQFALLKSVSYLIYFLTLDMMSHHF